MPKEERGDAGSGGGGNQIKPIADALDAFYDRGTQQFTIRATDSCAFEDLF